MQSLSELVSKSDIARGAIVLECALPGLLGKTLKGKGQGAEIPGSLGQEFLPPPPWSLSLTMVEP